MRFRLYFELENEHFPVDYRRCIMSYIKMSLKQYDEEYYKKMYNEKDPIIKPFCYATFFVNPQFKEDEILLHSKIFQINFSVASYEIGVALTNSFNHQKDKPFSINRNSWTLKNMILLNEKEITQEKIKIKLQSPLIARLHEDKKDYYYSYAHEEFEKVLKINIKEQLKITDMPLEYVDTFTIKPIESKKVIVKFYEKKIETSLGTFEISGDKTLLKYLYEAGIGSKRSSGFGLFEIVE